MKIILYTAKKRRRVTVQETNFITQISHPLATARVCSGSRNGLDRPSDFTVQVHVARVAIRNNSTDEKEPLKNSIMQMSPKGKRARRADPRCSQGKYLSECEGKERTSTLLGLLCFWNDRHRA